MGTLITPPCYKYIARNLSSPDERYVFSRQFFEKMVSSGADLDDCLVLYSAFEMPSSVDGLYKYNGVELKPQDYYEHILSLDDIPSVTCPNYYRSAMKPNNQNNVCQLCKLSRSCKNTNSEIECSIFKYIALSSKNYESFMSLGVDGVFKYCVDIASELSFDAPAIVPILSCAFTVIKNSKDDFYSEGDLRTRLNGLVGKITVEATKNPSVKEVQMKNHKALPISWDIVVNAVMSANDLNYDELCAEVSKIDLSGSKRKKKNKKTKALVEESPLFDYLNEMGESSASESGDINKVEPEQPDSVSASSVELLSETPDIPIEPIEPAADENEYISVPPPDLDVDGGFSMPEPPDDEELPFGGIEVDVPDDIPTEYMSDEPEESVSEDTAENSPEQQESSNDTGPVEAVESSGDPNSSESPKESAQTPVNSESEVSGQNKSPENVPTASEPKQVKYRVPPISEDELIYNIVIRRDVLKNYASPYKSVEMEAFSGLQKAKRLPVEVVFDDSGAAYLFMFLRTMGQYAYCPIDNDIPNSLIAILLSKNIIKICYQPYFLYSLLRLYDVRVCGVYSICTMDNLLHPDAVIGMYGEFFHVFDEHFKNIPAADTGFPDFDELLVDMQKYIYVHAIQTRADFDKYIYVKHHSRDEVLGSSFLRIINLKSNDYLFQLNNDGQIIYNPNYDQVARHDGFFVTYSVSADDVPGFELSEVYLDALYELSIKGRFRKYNIQLITISATAMVLFIGESEYELLTTALQKYFNRFAQLNHLERFELNVSHERVYCKTPKGAKQRQTPKTYEQAMDMLITTNDSVSVSPSHVVKRSKVKRKRQTKQFDPNK